MAISRRYYQEVIWSISVFTVIEMGKKNNDGLIEEIIDGIPYLNPLKLDIDLSLKKIESRNCDLCGGMLWERYFNIFCAKCGARFVPLPDCIYNKNLIKGLMKNEQKTIS